MNPKHCLKPDWCLKKISLHLTVVKFIPACTHVSLNEDLALRKLSIWIEYFFYSLFLMPRLLPFFWRGKQLQTVKSGRGKLQLGLGISFPSLLIQKYLGEFLSSGVFMLHSDQLSRRKKNLVLLRCKGICRCCA